MPAKQKVATARAGSAPKGNAGGTPVDTPEKLRKKAAKSARATGAEPPPATSAPSSIEPTQRTHGASSSAGGAMGFAAGSPTLDVISADMGRALWLGVPASLSAARFGNVAAPWSVSSFPTTFSRPPAQTQT